MNGASVSSTMTVGDPRAPVLASIGFTCGVSGSQVVFPAATALLVVSTTP